MSIQKSTSLILSTMLYRESSLLVTLLSAEYGRLQGIAKGVRSAGKRTIPLERGMCIEHVVYVKSTREIQTLADIQIVKFYPETRENIEKTAIRDTVFELVLVSVKAGDHGPELFSLLESFLSELALSVNTSAILLYKLWNFHFEFAALMGFAHNFGTCVKCNSSVLGVRDGGYLVHEKGGICCSSCGRSQLHVSFYIPPVLLSVGSEVNVQQLQTISGADWARLIRLASTYCRVHLDFKYALRSLDFLEQVFATDFML